MTSPIDPVLSGSSNRAQPPAPPPPQKRHWFVRLLMWLFGLEEQPELGFTYQEISADQSGRVRQGGVISAVAVGHRQAALAVMCRG